VVALRGADVRRFANGMFTNNVRDLPVGGGHRTAMCDAKGKLHGLMRLYLASDEEVVAALEGVTVEEFEERYGKYVVFDDVELIDRSAEVAGFTVQGVEADSVLRACGWPVPERDYARSGVEVLRHARAGEPGVDVLVPRSLAAEAEAALQRAGAVNVPWAVWDVARVEAGRVRWPVDMPGRFLLHELGLRDEVCHFEKGCYIGQEIIHRVDVMGQIRRALVGVRIEEMPLSTGPLPLEREGSNVGTLTSVVHSERFGCIGLAVLRQPLDTPGTALSVVDGERRIGARVSGLPFG
jgi:folate-binding protein YgfZ